MAKAPKKTDKTTTVKKELEKTEAKKTKKRFITVEDIKKLEQTIAMRRAESVFDDFCIDPSEVFGDRDDSDEDMMGDLMEWSMDALLYQCIILISRKQGLSIEEAAKVLDVEEKELEMLHANFVAECFTDEKETVLRKYSKRMDAKYLDEDDELVKRIMDEKRKGRI